MCVDVKYPRFRFHPGPQDFLAFILANPIPVDRGRKRIVERSSLFFFFLSFLGVVVRKDFVVQVFCT